MVLGKDPRGNKVKATLIFNGVTTPVEGYFLLIGEYSFLNDKDYSVKVEPVLEFTDSIISLFTGENLFLVKSVEDNKYKLVISNSPAEELAKLEEGKGCALELVVCCSGDAVVLETLYLKYQIERTKYGWFKSEEGKIKELVKEMTLRRYVEVVEEKKEVVLETGTESPPEYVDIHTHKPSYLVEEKGSTISTNSSNTLLQKSNSIMSLAKRWVDPIQHRILSKKYPICACVATDEKFNPEYLCSSAAINSLDSSELKLWRCKDHILQIFNKESNYTYEPFDFVVFLPMLSKLLSYKYKYLHCCKLWSLITGKRFNSEDSLYNITLLGNEYIFGSTDGAEKWNKFFDPLTGECLKIINRGKSYHNYSVVTLKKNIILMYNIIETYVWYVQKAEVWDLDKEERLHEMIYSKDASVKVLSKKYFCFSESSGLKIWNLETGDIDFMGGCEITPLVLSNGNVIISTDKTLQVRNLEKREILFEFQYKVLATTKIQELLFDKLLITTEDKIEIRSSKDEKLLFFLSAVIYTEVFESNRLLIRLEDAVKIWDLSTNTCVPNLGCKSILISHLPIICKKYLLEEVNDGKGIRIWNLKSGSVSEKIVLPHYSSKDRSKCFQSLSEKYLLIAVEEIQIWNLETLLCEYTLSESCEATYELFSDKYLLAKKGQPEIIRIIDLETRVCLASFRGILL
jgi:hypothetical protein